MVKENPTPNFESEISAEVARVLSNDKIVIRAFYMIVSTTAIFGLLGGIAGWIMAVSVPAYFRDVYDTPQNEIWQVGVGIGVTSGLLGGLLIGCSVLLATAWYRSRLKNALLEKYKSPM